MSASPNDTSVSRSSPYTAMDALNELDKFPVFKAALADLLEHGRSDDGSYFWVITAIEDLRRLSAKITGRNTWDAMVKREQPESEAQG